MQNVDTILLANKVHCPLSIA